MPRPTPRDDAGRTASRQNLPELRRGRRVTRPPFSIPDGRVSGATPTPPSRGRVLRRPRVILNDEHRCAVTTQAGTRMPRPTPRDDAGRAAGRQNLPEL